MNEVLCYLIGWARHQSTLGLLLYLQNKINKFTKNKTKQNKTKQNKTKQNKTKQNKTKQNKTKQNKTKQNKTKQNKTKQNKTKQNKTKQNKKKEREKRYIACKMDILASCGPTCETRTTVSFSFIQSPCDVAGASGPLSIVSKAAVICSSVLNGYPILILNSHSLSLAPCSSSPLVLLFSLRSSHPYTYQPIPARRLYKTANSRPIQPVPNRERFVGICSAG